MKLVTKINERISICADEGRFVVKVKPNQRLDKQESWYFPTLDMCFKESYDTLYYHVDHLVNSQYVEAN